MSADWKEIQLGSECTIKSSKRIFRNEYVEMGIPFYRSKEIIDKSLGSFCGDELFISYEKYHEIKENFGSPQKGDMLISSVGNRSGIPYVIQDEGDFYFKDGNLIWLSEFNNINSDYLCYLFKSDDGQSLLKSVMIGSAQKALTIDSIRKLFLRLPPIEYQIFYAQILISLDTKIALNRQINQTLESMSQAIFKSWFVDFEPVKAKIAALESGEDAEGVTRAAMRAISDKTDDDLDTMEGRQPDDYTKLKTTAELFPAAMQDSELGEVPEGWEVKLSGEIMDVRDGTHDSPKKSEKGFPLLTSKHITSGILMMDTAYLISQQDYENVNKRSKVNQGDILLTMIGTVGIPYLVMQRDVNFAIKNVGLFRTSENNCLKNYFYLLLKSEGMQKYLEARMAGTTQKYISLKTLRSIELLVPSGNIMDCFYLITNSLLDYSYALHVEAGYLAKLRDTLLPKLLSGELSVDTV